MTGTTLSHYRIVEELGRGGMGIVYKAEDTKLDRTVAIKVLPTTALASSDDRERFYREARAAAALHHPHIATVFEIDEAVASDAPHGTQPSPFIAMEFVDGGSLKEEIDKGPMDLRRAVGIGIQIAEALKTAHSKNIVHRDIKGHNVMLNREGDAKVLDFGLAKTAQSTMLTRMGSTLGTAAYMSPEQARGEEVDGRSDIWSLGVVLYEMISGQLPFAGEYEKAVMYGILNEMPPPLTSLRTGVPMGLEWIVTKMLAKSPDERYQSCSDLIVDLKTVDLSASGLSRMSSATSLHSAQSQVVSGTASRIPSKWFALLLLPIGIAIGWLAFGGSGARKTDSPATKTVRIELPDALFAGGVAITHDGSKIVGTIQSNIGIGIQSFDLRTGELKMLVPGVQQNRRSISYDDQWFSYEQADQLWKVRLTGGAPVLVTRVKNDLVGHTWLPDGSIIASSRTDSASSADLYQFPADGSEPILIAQAPEQMRYISPISLHRNDLIAFTIRKQGQPSIGVLDVNSGDISELDYGMPFAMVGPDHLLYFEPTQASAGTGASGVRVRPFDVSAASFTGPPISVEEGTRDYWIAVDDFGTYYSISLAQGGQGTNASLQAYAMDGEQSTVSVVTDNLTNISAQPRLSPDGKRVMVRFNVENHQELREYNLETGVSRSFTVTDDGDADNISYSPDGSEIMYESDNRLFRRNANRSGSVREYETPGGAGALDWSASGKQVVFVGTNPLGFGELYLLNLETEEVEELDAGEGLHGWPRFSPDERFISYSTRSQGTDSYWVMSLEDFNRIEVKNDIRLVYSAVWTDDGKYLYYDDAEGLWRVPIVLDPYFEIVGDAENVIGSELNQYDLVGDGSEIVAVVQPLQFGVLEGLDIVVYSDWLTELNQIAPPQK